MKNILDNVCFIVPLRMLWAGLVSLAAVGVAAQDKVASRACYHHLSEGGTIYDFLELDLFETRNVSLSDYRGQVSTLRPLRALYRLWTAG